MYSQVDHLFRELSKANTLEEVATLVAEMDQHDVLVLILRALTDRGFKSHASMLCQEWHSQEDMDGDGLIYGLDWHYINPPPLLSQIPKGGEPREFTPIR